MRHEFSWPPIQVASADVALQGVNLCDATPVISTLNYFLGRCNISGSEKNVKEVLKHVREILIVLPYLLLLFSVVLFLGVYRDMEAMEVRNKKLELQLDKTNDKLDYYIYRDSTSIGHTEGPEGYEEYKKRLGR